MPIIGLLSTKCLPAIKIELEPKGYSSLNLVLDSISYNLDFPIKDNFGYVTVFPRNHNTHKMDNIFLDLQKFITHS